MPLFPRWQQLAACRASELDLFFPISAKGRSAVEAARAKKICAACPVRSQCLDYAQATHQAYGIWGGLAEEERHQFGPGSRSPGSRCPA